MVFEQRHRYIPFGFPASKIALQNEWQPEMVPLERFKFPCSEFFLLNRTTRTNLPSILKGIPVLGNANDAISQQVLPTATIRQIDELAVAQFGMNSLVLMENAALGCVEWIDANLPRQAEASAQVATILCGRGNNGGDGLAIARHLRVRGWKCHVWVAADPHELSPDAQHNFEILTCHDDHFSTIPPGDLVTVEKHLATSTVILDCLLGTGATGAPRIPFDRLIQAANASPATRIAVDVPTGVDSETGHAEGVAFAADTTLSFVARKPAMAIEEQRHRFGKIVILPIGIPVALIARVLAETNS